MRRPAAAPRHWIIVLCTVLVLVLCVQFAVVAVDRIQHHLGIGHEPTALAGTVVEHDRVIPETDHAPDHDHVADAALGYLYPLAGSAPWAPVIEPAVLDLMLVQLIHGRCACVPERPPKHS